MKSRILIMGAVALTLCLSMVVEAQAADWLDQLRQSMTRRQSTQLNIHRFDKYPTMEFHSGQLSRSGWDDWKLAGKEIQMAAECQVENDEGEPCNLREGREVIVMGPRYGDKIVAYRICVLRPDWQSFYGNSEDEVDWSDSNPSVGVGEGPE